MHLIIVDMQEKLLPKVVDSEHILTNTLKIAKAFRVLNLPITVTEQNKLGKTVHFLRDAVGEAIVKTSFSCMGSEEFIRSVMGDRTFVLTGIETHICVLQTALDMLKYGFEVFLAVDATSSRKPIDRDVAIQRMSQEGIKLTTTEAVMYDLIRDSKHCKFKEILEIVKMPALELTEEVTEIHG